MGEGNCIVKSGMYNMEKWRRRIDLEYVVFNTVFRACSNADVIHYFVEMHGRDQHGTNE
jgi:hypothetical protein